MLISLVLSIILLLSLAPHFIPSPHVAHSTENIPIEDTKGIKSSHFALLSLGTTHVASTYLFPFMRDHVTQAEISNPHSKISLATGDASDTRSANNTWIIDSGLWEPSNDGVRSGDYMKTLHNVMVRPINVPQTDLDITTSFTINSLAPNNASYISIVYSWVDPQNFKYAGITLYNDNTYAHFGTVSNGILSFDPLWPGSRIDLDWSPGDPIRMTLSVRENSQELNVNGESVQQDSAVSPESGYVGLGYGRVQDVVFHDLDIGQS